jgi:hypothetical protein
MTAKWKLNEFSFIQTAGCERSYSRFSAVFGTLGVSAENPSFNQTEALGYFQKSLRADAKTFI